MQVKVPVELTFWIDASYSPGRPAKGPSYSSGGEPPEPAEWDIEKLEDITFTHTTTRLENGVVLRTEQKMSLLKQIDEPLRAVVAKALTQAITYSDLDQTFAEAVEQEYNDAQ